MGDGWTMDGQITLLVVDASVAVKFLVEEPGSEAAYAVATGPDIMIAPDWILMEVASALWKKVKFSRLLEINAEDNLQCLPDFFGRLFASDLLISEAFRLSFRLQHPVYDCLYLALALRENAKLITADREFHKAIERSGFERSKLLELP